MTSFIIIIIIIIIIVTMGATYRVCVCVRALRYLATLPPHDSAARHLLASTGTNESRWTK